MVVNTFCVRTAVRMEQIFLPPTSLQHVVHKTVDVLVTAALVKMLELLVLMRMVMMTIIIMFPIHLSNFLRGKSKRINDYKVLIITIIQSIITSQAMMSKWHMNRSKHWDVNVSDFAANCVDSKIKSKTQCINDKTILMISFNSSWGWRLKNCNQVRELYVSLKKPNKYQPIKYSSFFPTFLFFHNNLYFST